MPTTSSQDTHPFSREALFRQVGPLVAGALLGLLALASRQVPPDNAGLLLRAASLAALTVAATIFVPWHRMPRSAQIVPPLALLLVAALVRAATGGTQSVFSQLALLPMLWLASFGTRRELAIGLAGAALVLLGPVLPNAGPSDWSRGVTLVAAATVLGIVEQRFFEGIRSHTNQLQQLARVDPLTGAANRRAWEEEMQRAMARAARSNQELAITLIDLDRFKAFNDEHGHQAGDRFLKEVVAAWRECLRDSDVLARLGGDEFALLLPDCPVSAATRIVHRLLESMPAGHTFSAGVAGWHRLETPAEVVARADAALYASKDGGRGRMTVAPAADRHAMAPAGTPPPPAS